MRATFAVLFCGLSLLSGVTVAVATPGAVNAVWIPRSGAPQGSFAIYEKKKKPSCEDLRGVGEESLRIGIKDLKAGASGRPLQVKEFTHCIFFFPEPTPGSPDATGDDLCASGSIEYSYDAKANEYLGKYDLTMKHRAVRRGEFRAQFCEPNKPEKK